MSFTVGAASTPSAMAATAPAAELAPATTPVVGCSRPTDGLGYYTGTARCPVRNTAWTYYTATLTYFDDCTQILHVTSTIRMQITARRTAQGVLIGGVWVWLLDGSRRFGSMQFTAVDGRGATRNGAWNNNGNFSHNINDILSGSAITYTGVTPTNFVGMVSTAAANPYFIGQYALANNPTPYLSGPATCRMNPLSVVFTQ